eukprot:SAG11_NODE_7655_length_1114_cov_2.146798_1_plen_119_part_00
MAVKSSETFYLPANLRDYCTAATDTLPHGGTTEAAQYGVHVESFRRRLERNLELLRGTVGGTRTVAAPRESATVDQVARLEKKSAVERVVNAKLTECEAAPAAAAAKCRETSARLAQR